MPDVEFGPIREWKHANGFPGPDAGIEQIPELGALMTGIPDVILRAEREDAFFPAALSPVRPRAAESRVETVEIERLLERFGLHHMRMQRGTGRDRIDAGA